MIKQTALSLALLSLAATGFTQLNERKWYTTDVTKVTFFEPGIGHEFSLNHNQTILLRSGLTATIKDDFDSYNRGLLFRGFLSFSARHYYNFARRQERGKYIGRNSANYFALLLLGATSPIGDAKDYNQVYNNPMLNAGIVWGLQRNFRGRFSVDLNIGIGYGKVGDYERTIPVGEFNLGMWLGSKHGERKKNKRGGEWYE